MINKAAIENDARPYKLNKFVAIIKSKNYASFKHLMEFLEKHPKLYDEDDTIFLQAKERYEPSWAILQYLSYLDPDFIDTELIEQIFKLNGHSETEEFSQLIKLLNNELSLIDFEPKKEIDPNGPT